MIRCPFFVVVLFYGDQNQESTLVSLLSLTHYFYGSLNIYPISHVHIVPIERCASLYAFITNGSMRFPSMFIQSIVDVYRSKSKGQKLFFPLFIFRILRYLEMSEFRHLELVHIMVPIGTTYLRQRQA